VLETSESSPPASFNPEAFKQAVFQRLFAITVPARSKDAVQSLISKLQTVLEGIVLQNAGGMFTDCVSSFVRTQSPDFTEFILLYAVDKSCQPSWAVSKGCGYRRSSGTVRGYGDHSFITSNRCGYG
jgi:hypothetical protein